MWYRGLLMPWVPLMDLSKKVGKSNLGKKKKRKRWKKGKGICFCMFLLPLTWCFLKAGFVASHSVTKFLLVPLLLECLFFPVWWSLWLRISRMTDPIETEYPSVGLCASLLATHVNPNHTWHTSNTAVNSHPFYEQSRKEEAFLTLVQSPAPTITEDCAFLQIQTTSSD